MRAVIYCRVSTEEEVQVNALKSQIQEAIAAVKREKWLLIDQYIDEGKTGTTTAKRSEYNRLVSELELDKFDVVVVKSQDRLMRNTKEWYIFVDKLVQAHKKLYFYLESKFYTADDALITGIRAILAEEFSRDLSKKINNAHRNRQEKGTSVCITSNTWGYDNVNKSVVINKSEAEIIKMIFNLSCDGFGSRIIAKKLESIGITNRAGGRLAEATIRRIIRNPLYMGTAVMNKQHIDFNTKKLINNSKDEWIFHEGIVPAIVSREVWEKANQLMDRRAVITKTEEYKETHRGINRGKNLLSSKIICGECGATYWLRFRKDINKNQIKEWECSEYVRRGRKTKSKKRSSKEQIGGCDNIHVKDIDLQNILFEIGQKVFSQDVSELQKALYEVIQKAISNDKADPESLKKRQNNIMEKRKILLDKMLDGLIPDELFRVKDIELKKEYDDIATELSKIEQHEVERESDKQRIEEIMQEITDINDRTLVITKLNEHIEKITIHSDHGIVSLDFMDDVIFNIKKLSNRRIEYTL